MKDLVQVKVGIQPRREGKVKEEGITAADAFGDLFESLRITVKINRCFPEPEFAQRHNRVISRPARRGKEDVIPLEHIQSVPFSVLQGVIEDKEEGHPLFAPGIHLLYP